MLTLLARSLVAAIFALLPVQPPFFFSSQFVVDMAFAQTQEEQSEGAAEAVESSEPENQSARPEDALPGSSSAPLPSPATEEPAELAEPLPSKVLATRRDELAMTQVELRQLPEPLVGLQLGPGYPWQNLALALQWPTEDGRTMWNIQVGFGDFEITENRQSYTFFMESRVLSVWGGYRRFWGDYPLFWEWYGGTALWNGEIRPRGNEQVTSVATDSLTSDLSHQSVGMGLKLGLFWQWANGLFVEYAIVQPGLSKIIREEYTNNTGVARAMSENQIEQFRWWGAINIKVGYRLP